MVKAFIDLCVTGYSGELVKVLKVLGFKAVMVTSYDKRVSRADDLVIVRGVVLSSSSDKELRNKLRGIKEEYVIVFTRPLSISAARFSGRDSRIDGVFIDQDTLHYIDRAQISLMKQFSKPLILPLSSFLNTSARIKSMIYRRVIYAFNNGVNIIPVSYASGMYEVMIPISTIKLLEQLFGINEEYWLYMLTSGAKELLIKNGVKI